MLKAVKFTHKVQFNLPRGCFFPTVGGADFATFFLDNAMVGAASSYRTTLGNFLDQDADEDGISECETSYVLSFDQWWRGADTGMRTRSRSTIIKSMKDAATTASTDCARVLFPGKRFKCFKVFKYATATGAPVPARSCPLFVPSDFEACRRMCPSCRRLYRLENALLVSNLRMLCSCRRMCSL